MELDQLTCLASSWPGLIPGTPQVLKFHHVWPLNVESEALPKHSQVWALHPPFPHRQMKMPMLAKVQSSQPCFNISICFCARCCVKVLVHIFHLYNNSELDNYIVILILWRRKPRRDQITEWRFPPTYSCTKKCVILTINTMHRIKFNS